jgi:hypothetical protein
MKFSNQEFVGNGISLSTKFPNAFPGREMLGRSMPITPIVVGSTIEKGAALELHAALSISYIDDKPGYRNIKVNIAAQKVPKTTE